jgi:hypothetical protein
MKISIYLSDQQIIRTRTVYDVITLIAEVSGFADLWVLGFGSLIGTLISPKLLQTELINQIQFSVLRKKKRKVSLSKVKSHLSGTEVREIVKAI